MRKRQRYSKARRTSSRGRNSRRRTTARKSHNARRTTRRTSRRTTKSFNSKSKQFTTMKTMTSPFAKTFVSGVKSGQPTFTVVSNISKRTGKSFNTICQSLVKAGVCRGQKFNGQWICWPNFKSKTSNASSKKAQCTLWQGLVDWCITSGNCTFKNLNSKTGNQAQFMKSLQNMINRQCTLSGTAKIKAGKTSSWTKTYSLPTWSSNYAFPAFRNGTYSRRYSKAA